MEIRIRKRSSHEKKCAVLTVSAAVDEAAVKAAVTDAGYDYLGME